jgi:S-adenosylmethionine hydrolase
MTAQRPIVTLTTDFGRADTFVGEMHGSILAIEPDAAIVDLTHDVPAHDVEAGAFLLDAGTRAFPPGAIHIAVVDPGVGSVRPAIAVRTADGVWVGPDNGVLGRVLRDREVLEAHRLDAEAYVRRTGATTFEGRDRFAPAAGWIARGTPLRRFGAPVTHPRIAPPVPPLVAGAAAEIPVAHVDRFGNVFLDVTRSALPNGCDPRLALAVDLPDGTRIEGVARSYAETEQGAPVLVFNAAGVLEIAVREASASERFALRRGDRVRVTVRDDPRVL